MARLRALNLPDDVCWPWPGARGPAPRDYGRVRARGLRYGPLYVHRLVWEALTGAEPDPSLDVLHTCDNPPCGNPTHLFTGTAKDNTADMIAKGRGWWQKGLARA